MSTIDIDHFQIHEKENDLITNQKNLQNSIKGNGIPKQCRICLEETLPLIIPCRCSGTVKYVHQQCLMHWARQLVQKSLKKQEQNGDYQPQTSIECELCRQDIQLKIQWKNKKLSFDQARIKSQDYFWPGIIVNTLIGIISFGCVGFSVAVLILVLTKNSTVDYERFSNEPYVTWSILIGSFFIGLIFLYKSISEIYLMFIKKEFRLQGVVYKDILRNSQNKEVQKYDTCVKPSTLSDVKINLELERQFQNQNLGEQNQQNKYSRENRIQQQKSDANLVINRNQNKGNLQQSYKLKSFPE